MSNPAEKPPADPGAPPVCGQCGQPSQNGLGRWRWCDRCECYLVPDDQGDWVSPAELDRRRRAADALQITTFTAAAVAQALPILRPRLPEGWQLAEHPPQSHGVHSVVVRPPVGAIDVDGYLSPPYHHQHAGWHVEVWNRTRGVGFPLYIPGGARAAYYADAVEAFDGAVNALRIELVTR